MTLLLLVIIYIAFIGLGIPDSLIGSAWPGIYVELALPVSYISFVTFTISGCTVLSSMFSDRVIQKLGTGIVTAVSTLLTAVALIGFSHTQNFFFMCLLAIPLGTGAGAIDSGLNNYVALHFSAKHMNFLHCFYGIGVSCSPYLMSLALAENNWRLGYRYTFVLQIIITVLIIVSLPLWKKRDPAGGQEEEESKILPVKDMIKMPQIRLTLLISFMTSAIEYVCGSWGSTYLVGVRGFSPENGAKALTIYYMGMALGRLVSGLISPKVGTWRRIWIGVCTVAVAVVLFFAPVGGITVAAFFLVGFGNGAIYPNLIYLTPYNFGKDISQSVMGTQIAVAYMGVMLTPPLFGVVVNTWGLAFFPMFMLLLFVAMTVSVILLVKNLKASGNYRPEL